MANDGGTSFLIWIETELSRSDPSALKFPAESENVPDATEMVLSVVFLFLLFFSVGV